MTVERWTRTVIIGLVVAGLAACSPASDARLSPRSTLFIGVDVSGSFEDDGRWDDAMEFASYYIYGHLNELAELEQPRALFVGAIGGQTPGQPQAFHPIHDFEGKTPAEIEADLREWFAPDDRYTDFNAFFQRAATLVQRQNLALAPVTLVLLSDGVPDVGREGRDTAESARYARIDLDPLEYLARNVTVRLLYPDPAVAVHWERDVPRNRVRMWTVDAVVMDGWREQLRDPEQLAMATERMRDPRISGPEPAPVPGDEEAAGDEAVADEPNDAASPAQPDDSTGDAETADEPGTADAGPAGQGAPARANLREPQQDLLPQPGLWRWIKDNVDFRVRRTVL